MKAQTKSAAAQCAGDYLQRIAALTGADPVCGDSYRIKAGRRTFLVNCKVVRLISHHGKSTCFSVARGADMPSAEMLASALLHLKNNPKLFKKWRKQPGNAFKANGKKFRDVLRQPEMRPQELQCELGCFGGSCFERKRAHR